MRMAGVAATALTALMAAVSGCGEDERESATELAPSQISAATAPEPAGIPACDVGDLTFESAPEPVDGVAAAVIRIGSQAGVRCEVDVFESPLVDPLMEPDVWIEPGGVAELLVEHADSTCDAPGPVAVVELRVNDVDVDVPVNVESTCGLALTAIYAVEPGQ